MKVLAFDFGASSGRGIIGELKNNQIELTEIHRFGNDPVNFGGQMRWDVLRLIHEIRTTLIVCKNQYPELASIGVDTWGVDYGRIDKAGHLIGNPFHYRDARTEGMIEKVTQIIPKNELIKQSGIDCLPYNTLYQVVAQMASDHPFTADETILLMPDLFNYYLTGERYAEFSIATTTQYFDYQTGGWHKGILGAVGIPKSILPPIIASGKLLGPLKQELKDEMGLENCQVVSVGSHDTASAIAAVPATEKDFIYIATGTWIMVGTELEQLLMNDKTIEYGLCNEGGVLGKVNLLRNMMGLWLLQESKRQWEKEGLKIGFGGMIEAAKQVKIESIIDPDDASFYQPGDMPEKIKAFCAKNGQQVPTSVGEIVRVIEQSLAKKIAQTIEHIEEVTEKTYETIHMFGGGIQDGLLCQLIANATGKSVITGPKEATAMGNMMLQFMALGIIKDLNEGREIIANSIESDMYHPE